GLALFALAAADVQVVHDPDQPGSNAEFLKVKIVRGSEGAEEGFLDEVFGAVGVAGHAAGDAVEHVEMLQSKGFELLSFDLHGPRRRMRIRARDGRCKGRGSLLWVGRGRLKAHPGTKIFIDRFGPISGIPDRVGRLPRG